jgi:pimeloyl-ACP methyl ester carboxylesterase
MDLPALVLVGSHDHLTPPRHAWRTAAAQPRAELVELPRCGHMPMLERRREFGRLVDEFSAKVR